MHSFHPGLDRLCQVSKPTATTPCAENKLLVSPGWLWRNCGSPSLVAQCILVSSIKVDVFGLRGSKKNWPMHGPFSSGSHSANLICLVRAEPPSPQCSKLFPNSQASWNAATIFPESRSPGNHPVEMKDVIWNLGLLWFLFQICQISGVKRDWDLQWFLDAGTSSDWFLGVQLHFRGTDATSLHSACAWVASVLTKMDKSLTKTSRFSVIPWPQY